ncbi:Bax inhibitor-1/YccA family protein [Acetobacter sp. AN02]|uniref:Bax inhibitor-1/YccA family protein n=1 Tax=Acetobacter sp. AN02 TaxID=2894186 RepID=UPI00243453A3|nr:Bax inhibitor-1/YccA family protein [Acetobacter sp. AN02]MDG6094677.1 Bax inhibitor-1/YccA family protein [Acetobacter sp. AN02]
MFSRDYQSSQPYAGAQQAALDTELRSYMLRVYNWMASGLLLTAIVAYAIANTSLRHIFFREDGYAIHPTGLGLLAMIAPLGFVMVMSFGVNRLSRQAVQTLFWVFCAVMGASLSSIFFVYTDVSVARVFLVTAGTFAGTSLWGYVTKADLSRFGSFLMMGLIGLIVASIVNMFMHSAAMYFVISLVGVFLFIGLTAFDTQRIKMTYLQFAQYEGADEAAKRSVYDALNLYLNFINLFQFLLQFMGVRSSSND